MRLTSGVEAVRSAVLVGRRGSRRWEEISCLRAMMRDEMVVGFCRNAVLVRDELFIASGNCDAASDILTNRLLRRADGASGGPVWAHGHTALDSVPARLSVLSCEAPHQPSQCPALIVPGFIRDRHFGAASDYGQVTGFSNEAQSCDIRSVYVERPVTSGWCSNRTSNAGFL